MSRKVFLLVVALVTALTQLSAVAGAQDPAAADVGTVVEIDDTTAWVVEFVDRADLSFARSITDRADRTRAVADALQRTASRSQGQAIDLVRATPGASYEAFWMRNVIVVEGTADLAAELRALPGVLKVRPEQSYEMMQPVAERPAAEAPTATAALVGDPEWGVDRIGADDVWALGITGAGVVVGSLDSGVQYDHPALVDSYRGNNGDGTFDHNYNFFDATGICGSDEPCDELGHGTHTMGTMVGGDGPGPFAPDIGVAPDAQWMSVSCGPFFCSESELMAAGEFFITPTDLNGENPDPSKAPHVVNNSWGGGPGDPFFLDMVNAWRAAGILPVFASGNPGPFCEAGGSPGDYNEVLSVGATDINDVIADFSGRGPSAFGKINPDVSAPGVDVVSSVPGNGYAAFSGTSMATPHTVGTLALMMSASPDLIGQIDDSFGAIKQTAMDIIDLSCGGDADGDPNNVYGEGRVDALAAIALVATGGTLEGTVTDAGTGDPIAGAKISADDGERVITGASGTDGTYKMFLVEGTYDVSATAFAYLPTDAGSVDVVVDQATILDIAMERAPEATITGIVSSIPGGSAVEGAQVKALGTPVAPAVTGADGSYSLTLPLGSYTLEAGAGGCLGMASADVELTADTAVNFELVRKVDSFGHVCNAIPFDWLDAERRVRFPRFADDIEVEVKLPFTFPFYGRPNSRVFISSNGYVSFTRSADFSPFFNTPIPDPDPPNNAIYALWDDLWVDDETRVLVSGNRYPDRFVIEYENIPQLGSSSRSSFQIQLWRDGTIDILYADDIGNLGNGSNATIGLERRRGVDAFQFGFNQPVAGPETAWRYSVVDVGRVQGTVTNANDGLPVEGATITAQPGGRSATTGESGMYTLALLPGDYELTAEADDYASAEADVSLRRHARVDFVLDAAELGFSPDAIAAAVDFGETANATLTLENTGQVPLEWELFERDFGVTPPTLPPAALAAYAQAHAGWSQPDYDRSAVTIYSGGPDLTAVLAPVIDDPEGDAQGSVDITVVEGGLDDQDLSIRVNFTDGSPVDEVAGYIFFDTDQNEATGLDPQELFGLPTQTVGVDFFADMFASSEGIVFIVSDEFELVAEVEVVADGQSLAFDVPAEAFGEDLGDGVNTAMVLGDFFGPTDWAPDVGHGEISAFGDAPWIQAEPVSGIVEPGESVDVEVLLGGPDTLPGTYEAELVIVSNAPRTPRVTVPVSLEVAMPDDFGVVEGTVIDEVTGEPIRGAEVAVASEFGGSPLDLLAETDSDGHYVLVGPAGTWPATIGADEYVTLETDVTIEPGLMTTADFALTPVIPLLHVSPSELSFTLEAGGTDSGTVVLDSVGVLPVDFTVVENVLEAPSPEVVVPTGPDGTALIWDSDRSFMADLPAPAGGSAAYAGEVVTIIDDPAGDAIGVVDVVSVDAGVDAGLLTLTINFSEDTVMDEAVGLVFFDIDQNPETGIPAPEFGGLPEQDVGFEFFADFFPAPDGFVVIVSDDFEVVAEPEVIEDGQSYTVVFPVDVFGPTEDGTINVAMWAGDFEQQSDWAPDAGHGEIVPFEDAPWLSVDPTEGSIDPGVSQDLAVAVDATGLVPGTYVAELRIGSNDPLNPVQTVLVTLDVI